jgi:hypothetical protein
MLRLAQPPVSAAGLKLALVAQCLKRLSRLDGQLAAAKESRQYW